MFVFVATELFLLLLNCFYCCSIVVGVAELVLLVLNWFAGAELFLLSPNWFCCCSIVFVIAELVLLLLNCKPWLSLALRASFPAESKTSILETGVLPRRVFFKFGPWQGGGVGGGGVCHLSPWGVREAGFWPFLALLQHQVLNFV